MTADQVKDEWARLSPSGRAGAPASRAMGGEVRLAKQHAAGELDAPADVARLLDPGTFRDGRFGRWRGAGRCLRGRRRHDQRPPRDVGVLGLHRVGRHQRRQHPLMCRAAAGQAALVARMSDFRVMTEQHVSYHWATSGEGLQRRARRQVRTGRPSGRSASELIHNVVPDDQARWIWSGATWLASRRVRRRTRPAGRRPIRAHDSCQNCSTSSPATTAGWARCAGSWTWCSTTASGSRSSPGRVRPSSARLARSLPWSSYRNPGLLPGTKSERAGVLRAGGRMFAASPTGESCPERRLVTRSCCPPSICPGAVSAQRVRGLLGVSALHPPPAGTASSGPNPEPGTAVAGPRDPSDLDRRCRSRRFRRRNTGTTRAATRRQLGEGEHLCHQDRLVDMLLGRKPAAR